VNMPMEGSFSAEKDGFGCAGWCNLSYDTTFSPRSYSDGTRTTPGDQVSVHRPCGTGGRIGRPSHHLRNRPRFAWMFHGRKQSSASRLRHSAENQHRKRLFRSTSDRRSLQFQSDGRHVLRRRAALLNRLAPLACGREVSESQLAPNRTVRFPARAIRSAQEFRVTRRDRRPSKKTPVRDTASLR
jgi:hypothetical protein